LILVPYGKVIYRVIFLEYQIKDIEGSFNGEIIENLGNNEYVIKIDDKEHNLKILSMDSRGIEFVLDQKYHIAKYLDKTTSKMDLVVDGVSMQVNMHSNLDEIVYKHSGGAEENAEINLQSQIPGKVVKISVSEGSEVKEGDEICVLESMKMQVAIKSHKNGIVKSVKIKEGASVAKGDTVAEIE